MKTYFRAKPGNKVLPSEARHGSYFLPKELRPELRKIWGAPIFGRKTEVIKQYKKFIQERRFNKIITVGDYCSLTLPSDIKIFDGKVKGEKIKKVLDFSLYVSNPPGTIQKSVWPVIKKAIRLRKNVFVDGEEDLLVIPVILLSEKNTAVVYGFPQKGVCLIEASRQTKREVKELLKKFRANPVVKI